MTADANEKLRRLPRFSLRSLILLVALAGCGYGLWMRWAPWVREVYTAPDLMPHPGAQVATTTNVVPSPDGVRKMFKSGIFFYKDEEAGLTASDMVVVEDASSGESIAYLTTDWMDEKEIAWFSRDGTRIFARPDFGPTISWRRRRPEWWWGVAWLPEFWMTLALGTGLLWSLRRDRKAMRPAA